MQAAAAAIHLPGGGLGLKAFLWLSNSHPLSAETGDKGDILSWSPSIHVYNWYWNETSWYWNETSDSIEYCQYQNETSS